MDFEDELENFIRERKARVAEDKAVLEQDPPYMEMKAKPRKAFNESALKENIPPKLASKSKDEGCAGGLPLGVEYDRKKQKLQHELRMNYRQYMAQQRDAATLSEDRRMSRHGVSEDDGVSSVISRYPNRRGRLIVQHVSEEEELFKDEPGHPESRRRRCPAAETMCEKNQCVKNSGRENFENRVGSKRNGRSAVNKSENIEFATGLLIGAANTDEILQRRKESYRQELQEQIAEQHRNKKKEKELELNVAATGANDPEKQPDRIKQFGLTRKRLPLDLRSTATRESELLSRTLFNDKKRDFPPAPTERSQADFQSPLLEYSSSLGLEEGDSPSSGHPSAPYIPNSMCISRSHMPVPHPPPPSLSGVYRHPYGESNPYHSTRNLPDPNLGYYGQLPAPTAAYPMPCWSLPPRTAGPGHFGNRSPGAQHDDYAFPEPPAHSRVPTIETDADPLFEGFPPARPRSTRDRTLTYGEALKQQEASGRGMNDPFSKIQEQQERKRIERQERERYEAQLEMERRKHQPWGRGGGGAPLRDSTGNLVADLNQMHKLNEEAYSNPEHWQRRAAASRVASRAEQPDPNERVSGFTHVQTSQFARGKVFSNQPSEQQLMEQDQYKAYLKQQIEEKMRKKAEERERTRLEEEKEERRLAEQRARIQKEYEEEQEKKRRKEMEQKAKNEELIQLAEQRKREAERKRKEAEEKENAALMRQYEREKEARVEEIYRQPSPPIPALQKRREQQQQHPAPTWFSADRPHPASPLTQSAISDPPSPPVPARRNQLRAAGDHEDLFSELSVLRRQLRSEQKRLECRLQDDDWEELESPTSIRSRDRPDVDVFDMARLRLQAPVRRMTSRNVEPRNLMRIHDSPKLKNTGEDSRFGSRKEDKLEERVGPKQRYHRDLYRRPSGQRSAILNDYLDLSPSRQNDRPESRSVGSEKDFLLESESAFIGPLGDFSPIPHTPIHIKDRQLTARERRRLTKQPQHAQQEQGLSSQFGRQRDDRSSQLSSKLQHEAEEGGKWKSRNLTGRLTATSRRGNTAGSLDLSDGESSPPQFSPESPDRPSSADTVVTDPWMRLQTSDTMTSLDPPPRRRRL